VSPDDAEEFTQTLGQIGGGLWRQIAWADRQGIPAALGLTTREWVEQRIGGYVRLAIPERREAVAELTAEGMSQRDVADVLGVGKTTIVRDLCGPDGPPDGGQQVEQVPAGPSGPPLSDRFAPDLNAYVGDLLDDAVTAAAGPDRPDEPPQWERLRTEGHDVTILARRLAASLDDMPHPSEATWVPLSVAASRAAADEMLAALDAWITAITAIQPPTDRRLRAL
jgi:hypothetical protein